ncbi:PWWP domain-containing protein [Phyllosticta capitalensis]
MADQPTTAAAETAPKAEQTSTSPAEVKATTDDAPADGVTAESKGEAAAEPSEAVKSNIDEPRKPEPKAEDPASEKADNAEEKDEAKEDVKAEGDAGENTTAGVNGAAPKSNGKRKSTGGVPEHKTKKLNKKKSMPALHLSAKPGEYWWARMKGYSSWPVIICDEEMLPEVLLNKRPVSAIRPDGTYREDFADGGKNVRDRRYPVMFLGSNEFAWQPNTDLWELDMEDVQRQVAAEEQGKKSKALWEAWKVTAENHDLAYYKSLLMDHEKAVAQDAEERAQKEAEKAAKEAEKAERVAEKATKAAKKEKRKSKAGAADEDVNTDEAAETETPAKKASKKRKKDADSEADTPNPAKTPKTKLKVNGPKTPAETSTPKTKKTPASKAKASKKADSGSETPKVEEVLTPAQQHEKRSKAILYLRHRLQKGFLTREQVPKEEEMQQMFEYFNQLDGYRDLEVSIIRETKINKVLKAIIKLDSIPKDEVYNFKKRSSELLAVWNKSMSEANAGSEAPVKTNGVESKNENKEAAKNEKDDSEQATPAAEPAKAEPAKDSDAMDEDKPKAEEAPKDVEMKDVEDSPAAAPADAESKEGEKSDVAMEDAKPAEAAADTTEGETKSAGEASAAA